MILTNVQCAGHSHAPQKNIYLQLAMPIVCFLLFSISAAAAQDTSAKPIVHNLHEIGTALAACMQPLAVADQYPGIRITVRLGFNARGQLLGPPRFTYVTPYAPDRIKTEYKDAILDALKRCTPLSFSPGLGATIAGAPIILRLDEGGLIRADNRAGSDSRRFSIFS